MRIERGRNLALADALLQPVWTLQTPGTIGYVNATWQAYAGLSADDARRGDWRATIHPDDIPAVDAGFQQARTTTDAVDIEYRFRRADGIYRWHIGRISPLSGPDGTAEAWVVAALDVDDRQRSDAALRASETRFRDMVETASDIVYTLNLDGTVATVNPAIERILGYRPEEVIGRSIEDELIPADQVDLTRQMLARKIAGEERSVYELDALAKDGRRITLEINSHLTTVDTQPMVIQGIARDITARKQAREGLGRLAAIVEDSEDAIISRTLDGTITSWNRGAERLYGYTADEMIGKSVFQLVPPERADEIARITDRLARGERLPHVETVRTRKDGSQVDVSISLSPLTDTDNRIIGVSMIARDITARKLGEARLGVLAQAGRVLASDLDVDTHLASAARLAVPTLADWCVVDLVEGGNDLRRVAVSHSDPAKVAIAEELQRRYPPDPASAHGAHEVMRTGRSILVPAISDDLIAAAARDEDHLRLLRTVGLRSYLIVPLRARGRILGTLTFVSAESGRSYGQEDLAVAEALAEPAALAIDNARLYRSAQAAEMRYRRVFAGVGDAILLADADRHYLDANPAAVHLLGYSRKELLTMRIEDLVEADRAWTTDTYERFLIEGRWQGELELRRKDGTLVPVEALASVIELPTGPVYLSALRDVSERRRLERLRRDFLAMVTHDLRTPLAAVKGRAQMLRRRGEYRQSQVDAILAATDRMQRLINDLADVVRLETGFLLLRRSPVDLAALVREVATGAYDGAGERHVRIVAPSAPIVGEWDRDRLAQVVTNLLDNTVRHASPGYEATVRVEDHGEEARLAVVDHGPGIAPEHVPRLFDRFYRADATGAGGLGLGLYISRMLVEAHGGRIWAESNLGQGSTFTIALPKSP